MLSQSSVKSLPGSLHRFDGNQPILLNDLDTIWVIQSGSIAVFAVRVEAGAVHGARRYLFKVDLGEALFGTTIRQQTSRQFLAVPIGEVELLKLNRRAFTTLVTHQDQRIAELIEGWLQQLNAGISGAIAPAIQVSVEGTQRLSLINGQTLQPIANSSTWMQIQQGRMRWLGIEELSVDATVGIIPISDRFWLEAEGAVQLITQPLVTINDPSILLNGLSQLHHLTLGYIDLLEQQEIEEERQRLQAREQLNRQVISETLGELSSTLGTGSTHFFLEGTPLLVAAGAVGRAMGIKIRPPARSLNPKRVKDPLEAIARSSRIRLRSVLLRGDWWKQDCGPLVAYRQDDHQPVALLPVAATRYELFDPADRSRTSVNAEVANSLAPSASMFYRSLPDRTLTAIELLRFALKGQGRELLVIVFSGIAGALLGMLTPQANAILIDNAIPDSDRGLLLQVGLGLLVAVVGIALLKLAQGLAILRIETVSDSLTQAAVWNRLLNLPLSFFRQYTTGDLQSRVLSISTIRRQLSGNTLITLLSGLFALFNLALLFYYSWQLALIALAFGVATIAVTVVSGLFLVRKVVPLLELEGHIFGQTVQLINGISKLRVAGAEERAFASWGKNYSQQMKLELSTQFIEDAIALFNTVAPTLIFAVLFWFTIRLLTDAQLEGGLGLTIGTFLAFNSAFGVFSKGITEVSNTMTDALTILPQWKRVQPILATLPEVEQSKTDPGILMGRIALDHILFRYRADGPLVLDDVSIHAAPGEFIALVGGSGSGKSTIFRLLLGFEIPEAGGVYYDGQDLAGLDVDAVRRQLGVVLQSGRIMAGSIFDNIASGAQVTLDEAWEAAQMAGFADDITSMPMQMHTVISEGAGNLSGGQRQRLLIARALVLKPKILLFDEATSALDNRTQAIVSESLERQQVTRLVIAHRLSTIRNADRIYVLQAGRVIQQGTFAELATQKGLFAQLMVRQMETPD